jgi:predicted RecA/RadA family phage recombinase
MAQNFIQPGDVIEVTAGASCTAGSLYKHGSLVGVCLNSGANGDTVQLSLKGVFEVAKATGAGITAGALVYHVTATNNVSASASGNTLMGHAVEAAASGDTVAIVRLAQ